MPNRIDNRRNSNIELLRIIAIVLITFNHIYGKGVDKATVISGFETSNAIISIFYSMGGKFGCNLFLIISAWFLAEKNINWRAALSIWIQTVFYTFVLDIISVGFFQADFSTEDLLSVFLPLTVGTYWYSTAYVVMILAGPVIRNLLNKYTKLKAGLLFFGGIVFSVIPTLMLEGTILTTNRYITFLFKILTYPPIWFLYVYILIGHIKKRKIRNPNPKAALIIAASLYMYMFLVTFLLFRGVGSGQVPGTWQFMAYRQMNSPICLLSAYYLFVAARDAKPVYIQGLNRLAGYTYGIYLFQCHKMFQVILWKEIFQFELYFSESVIPYVLYCILGVSLIIIMGFLTEWLYKKLYSCLQKAIPLLH